MFNVKKSQVIIYSCSAKKPPNPNITINGENVDVVKSVILLCHLMTNEIYDFNLSKCIGDFNRQCNMFLADFKYVNSHIRNVLFQKYCTSFYGTQMAPLFDKCINHLYKAWYITICRVWCNMLTLIAGVTDPEFWFAKRSINFHNIALNSSSQNVKLISNMDISELKYGWKYKVIN